MLDLDDLLRQVERNDAPDLWRAVEQRQVVPRSPVTNGGRRWPTILVAVMITVAAIAFVWRAFGSPSGPRPAATVITSPAPRQCPFAFVRGETVGAANFLSLSGGSGPTWLPDGFGLQQAWGANDGFAATALWSDSSCREVMLLVGTGDLSGIHGSTVGPWTVGADAPGDCGNFVLGSARCLDYFASASDGRAFTLQMMGIDREDGDRIAQSINLQTETATPSSCQYGPWAELCPEADWVRNVLRDGGIPPTGDTGSAIVARRDGQQFYMWATAVKEERPLSQIVADERYVRVQSVDGTAVYSDGVRFFWQRGDLYVWVESGEEGLRIKPDLIATLVSSSLRTPMP